MSKEQAIKGTKILSFLKKIAQHYHHQPSQITSIIHHIKNSQELNKKIQNQKVSSQQISSNKNINNDKYQTKYHQNSKQPQEKIQIYTNRLPMPKQKHQKHRLTNSFQEEKIRIYTKNQLYHIPISINQNINHNQSSPKNINSALKLPNLQEKQSSNLLNEVETISYLKQKRSKKSRRSKREIQIKAESQKNDDNGQCKKDKMEEDLQDKKTRSDKFVLLMKTNKKLSVVPAFKPGNYKQRKKASIIQEPLDQFKEYLANKKSKHKIEQLLIVQSKKQQIIPLIPNKRKRISKIQKHSIEQSRKYITSKIYENIQSTNNEKKVIQSKTKYNQAFLNLQSLSLKYQKQKSAISFYSSNYNQMGIYDYKIFTYRELIFLVNFAHKVFDPLTLIETISLAKTQRNSIAKYSYYVGSGNNSMLIRVLMKRRPWWYQVKQIENANFVWTQLKIASIHRSQQAFALKQSQNVIEKVNIQKDIQDQQQLKIEGQTDINDITLSKTKYQSLYDYKIQNAKKMNPKGLLYKAPFTNINQKKILSSTQYLLYINMMQHISKNDHQNLQQRLKYLPKDYLKLKTNAQDYKVHNHLQFNHYLGNKKSLFYHMQLYYKIVSKSIKTAFPRTFHIKIGQNDQQYKQFQKEYKRIAFEEKQNKNIWILKPGQNSNRGTGITVIKDLKMLNNLIKNKQKHKNGQIKTFILQKYIQRPLLYKQRKFDIRHYIIVSSLYGRMRVYFYGQGYVRTSSSLFNLQEVNDPMIHLTNDAIQKNSEQYGQYEEGNKISYNDLQRYFTKEFPQRKFQFDNIYNQMKELAKDTIYSTYPSLDPNRNLHNFQIFGLDFMIDDHFNVMLIEVNTNPCLQLSSHILNRVIPLMLEQTFRITLDVLFPPNAHYTNNNKYLAPDCNLQKLHLQLIFDSERDGKILSQLFDNHQEQYNEMIGLLSGSQHEVQDVYDNDGEEIQLQIT